MRKITSVVLCLVMLLSLWCIPVSADMTMNVTAHCFDYEMLEDGTISITGYTPNSEDMSKLYLSRAKSAVIPCRRLATVRFYERAELKPCVFPVPLKRSVGEPFKKP